LENAFRQKLVSKMNEGKKQPLVAIVGKTNVGKSTLFNRLAKKRIAIVDPTPGVTRDFLEEIVDFQGTEARVVDTGGIEFSPQEPLQSAVERKAWEIIEEADLVMFVVDGRASLTLPEQELLARLRRLGKRLLLVINKREGMTHEVPPADFFSLGVENMLQISALHGDGIRRLKEVVGEALKEAVSEGKLAASPQRSKVVVLGKPNVGKSTLCNLLFGRERCIVSDVPGTTRDAVTITVDTPFGHYQLIDTAGLIRKARLQDAVSFYAQTRAQRALEEADLCILVIDPLSGVTRQDKRIAAQIAEHKKCCLVFLNKWDLVQKLNPGFPQARVEEWARRDLSFLYYASFLVGSALDASIREKIFAALAGIITRYHQRVKTSVLNEILQQELSELRTKGFLPARSKFYYATQTRIAPPCIRVYTNSMDEETKKRVAKIVEQALRRRLNWEGVPLDIELQRK